MDLAGLEFAAFRFRLKADDRFNLPRFVGSTLRGALGISLKKTVCLARDRESCTGCLLQPSCVYTYLFETQKHESVPKFRTISDIPRPFVIRPIPSQNSSLLTFDLILIGRAIELIPYLIFSVKRLEKSGLGPKRDRFTLMSVTSLHPEGEKLIFHAEEESLSGGWFVCSEEQLERRAEEMPDERATIALRSPVRIKSNGRLVSDLQFHHLIRALLRRISLLALFHCGFEVKADFKRLIEAAEGIRRTGGELKWIDLERFSLRQKSRVKMGGLVGEVEFEGDMRPFKKLLAAGEWLHVGKGCVMGLGRIEVIDGRREESGRASGREVEGSGGSEIGGR
ncbi:hypothetical protein DRP77_05755 [Candidatus Poribacteria bacterium]|nr:MAG: hypothetical protein DRP77_05755 [Candidatus Poribacteria bacterium]